MLAEDLEEEIKHIGAAIIQCSSLSKETNKNQRQWRVNVDASPEVCKIYWTMVDVAFITELEYLYWVVIFLKMYPMEIIAFSMVIRIDKKMLQFHK